MKTAKDFLKSEIEKHLDAARALTTEAEKDDRSLTDSERSTVEEHLAKAADLKAKVKDMEDNEALRDMIAGMSEVLTSGEVTVEPQEAKSLGEAFVKSEAYQALRKRGLAGRWTTGPIQVKAFGDVPGGGVTSEADSPALVQPMVVPGIVTPGSQAPLIADLFMQGVTGSNSVRYLAETTTTNLASGVAEGGEKPASAIQFDDTDEPVRKIATFLPVSDEMLEDEAAMASYLNSRLALFIRQKEDNDLLNGNGTAPNLSGVLDRAIGTAVAGDIGGTNNFDAVMAGITDVRVNGYAEPDAMIINPLDWAAMAIEKASTAGLYFSGGPYASPAQNPWGLRTVITSTIAAGSVLVGAFGTHAQIFRRGGLTIEASNSHSDWFRKDLTAIRAETRLALAVYRLAAFSVVTLAS